MSSMPSIPESLLAALSGAKHVVVFTGAGVSQESGIPTFRDELSGLWQRYDPQELATPEAFARQPDLVWGWYEFRRRNVMLCSPNAAHRTIAAMAGIFPRFTLITQNVDDLHERAGSQKVLHLHGNLLQPRCHECARAYPMPSGIPVEPATGWRIEPPHCPDCNGHIRPGVVWFGESLPEDAWQAAQDAAQSCDVFFSIGTSAVVYPAAALPELAARRGARLIQINPLPTPLDLLAAHNLHGKAGEVLTQLWTAFRA